MTPQGKKPNYPQQVERLEKQIEKLRKDNRTLDIEMVQRGKEITKMIRIFLVCENLLPDGQKEEFRSVALEYATRNDVRGSVYCRGKIDFRECRTADYGSLEGPG